MNKFYISGHIEREQEHVRFFEGLCFVLALYGVVGLIFVVLP